MTAALPQSWSAAEVRAALGIGKDTLNGLIRDGKVGYIRAGRSRRFLTEHIAQITAAIEVKPRAAQDDVLAQIGVTARSAAARRRSA